MNTSLIQRVSPPEEVIYGAGFPVYLHGFSAIDSYLGRNSSSAIHILCGADLADLARLFDKLRYPGAAIADAALDLGEKIWYFRCENPMETRRRDASFAFLEFYRDWKTGRFYDPNGIYPCLRRIKDGIRYSDFPHDAIFIAEMLKVKIFPCNDSRMLFNGAMILARYFPETCAKTIGLIAEKLQSHNTGLSMGLEEQRLLLTGLLEAANPACGFELLKRSGFISVNWPELAVLDNVDHSKEYHPEGNAWIHTMEALHYRKPCSGGFDRRLSLGLLLHDIGKPLSISAGNHRFEGHAELGARAAARFLERLGFEAPLVKDIFYLVKNHMLPAALKRLPLIKTAEIMDSPLFPVLMELYRCDESSSFKGLDGYYENSAAYRAFLRNRKNPYRSIDGKRREMPISKQTK